MSVHLSQYCSNCRCRWAMTTLEMTNSLSSHAFLSEDITDILIEMKYNKVITKYLLFTLYRCCDFCYTGDRSYKPQSKMYVTVETEQGTLRGQQKTSEYFSHKKYLSFQGIPYAKPPLGSLRFKVSEVCLKYAIYIILQYTCNGISRNWPREEGQSSQLHTEEKAS